MAYSSTNDPSVSEPKIGIITASVNYSARCLLSQSINHNVLTRNYQAVATDTLVCAETPLIFKACSG
ncbi:MAG: hypothetical protein U5L45_23020 [Saprospiraceae bacterium]|nr:hypothetical protein [Saprospiraceae bacterium]